MFQHFRSNILGVLNIGATNVKTLVPSRHFDYENEVLSFFDIFIHFRTVPIIVEKLQEAKHNAKGISSAMLQDERSKVMKDLKNFKIRVLVSSDLVSHKILNFLNSFF